MLWSCYPDLKCRPHPDQLIRSLSTVHGLRIFALSYLFSGLGIYGSGFFTALYNGSVSALLSFLRPFLFRGGMVLLLPLVLDLDGIWFAVVAADAMAVLAAGAFFWGKRKKYHYL